MHTERGKREQHSIYPGCTIHGMLNFIVFYVLMKTGNAENN